MCQPYIESATALSDIYTYPRARESQISMVLVSVGLASLAQLYTLYF